MRPKGIVPLHPATFAETDASELYDPNRPAVAPKGARLTYRGGALLTAPVLVPIFWGTAWRTDPALAGLATDLAAFLTWFSRPGGAMLAQLSEYSVPGQTLGPGSVTPSVFSDRPRWGKTITDDQIRASLSRGALKQVLPVPTMQTLYCVYLPPGYTVALGRETSCNTFCGYHDAVAGAHPYAYAVMPYPCNTGCLGPLDARGALTSVSSHELCEAVTDRTPGTGWYDDANGEVGDICAWQTVTLDGWVVQREWSNAQGACI